MDILDAACKDDCCHGTPLPHRVDEVLCAACICGATVSYDMTKGFSEQQPCVCGLSMAEAMVSRPETRLQLAHLRDPHDPKPWGPGANDPVVYFAEVGDLIKIGTSANLVQRLSQLHAVLLGTIPGSYDCERAMHHRFANLREHGEYFRRGADLLAFIDTETEIPEFFLEPPAPKPPVPQTIVRQLQQDIILR